jgi:tRNA U34 5-methylaminomethyl-2-thiouridine-forming methyltransferase MnmC
VSAPRYSLVTLANGVHSVRSHAEAETFHPVIGPVAEAEALYVRQLRLRERVAEHTGEFVIWDVGLGAAANVLTVLRATQDVPCHIRLVSFDHTLEPLHFALQHAEQLGYFGGYEGLVATLLADWQAEQTIGRQRISWTVRVGDFPAWLARTPPGATDSSGPPPPHAIFFDAYSPAKNAAMWTLPLFTSLFRHLDPARPCAMPTYSRATLLRVTWLLAGFNVGVGHATGEKEETTLAANTLALLDEPLDCKWLERVRRSTSAEPLHAANYRQAPLTEASWERLRAHPQFQ